MLCTRMMDIFPIWMVFSNSLKASTENPRFSPLPSIKPPLEQAPMAKLTISSLPSNKAPWGLIEFYLKVEAKQYLKRAPQR